MNDVFNPLFRLNLPGNIVENEDVSAKYDSDDGLYMIRQHFVKLSILSTTKQFLVTLNE